ncbi:polycystin cation channel protein [Cystoisospora suis]|uniref:Polycystin cation channel protein n=1 Tax=Cystoisospora suis TaxID=483139 RepID=A0A2C6K4T1_9APIC|nr:polycystin cation channel protein [Cystoisospora suis]
MQKTLVDQYGVEPRRRMALEVNDSVILHWKAFVKALQMSIREANEAGVGASVDKTSASLRDRFFDEFRSLPVLAKLPSTAQDRAERALLGTQLVRIQQYLTDIEFLRAKQFLILYDLQILGNNHTRERRRRKRKRFREKDRRGKSAGRAIIAMT